MSNMIMPPPEPDGPIWDRYGNRWDRGDSGLWDQEGSVSGDVNFEWEWWELFSRAPLFTTKPESLWKPEVGGVCETEEQYAALLEGSIVARDDVRPFIKLDDGLWHGESGPWTDLNMSSLTSPVLRVGWSL